MTRLPGPPRRRRRARRGVASRGAVPLRAPCRTLQPLLTFGLRAERFKTTLFLLSFRREVQGGVKPALLSEFNFVSRKVFFSPNQSGAVSGNYLGTLIRLSCVCWRHCAAGGGGPSSRSGRAARPARLLQHTALSAGVMLTGQYQSRPRLPRRTQSVYDAPRAN